MKASSSLYEKELVWDQKLQTFQKNVIQAYIDHWPTGVSSVLDVGCGDGKITHALASYFKDTSFHGLDESHEAVSRLSIPATQGSAVNLPFKNRQFDLVMTVDVLEHLSDSDEEAAWSELFRVSNKWVFVTVPFMENLKESTAKCHECGKFYHVNWHQRAYQIETLTKRFATGWSVAGVILSGEAWSPWLPPEINFRRRHLDEWNGWALATCPHCRAEGQNPSTPQALKPHQATQLGQEIYKKSQNNPFMRSHSEIIVAFSRFPRTLLRVGGDIATKITHPSALIEFKNAPISTNLVPYPQIARLAKAVDGGVVIQLPGYPSSLEKGLFKIIGKEWQATTDIGAVELIWESENNFASTVKITTFTEDSKVQEVILDQKVSRKKVNLIKFTKSSAVKRIRFDFSKYIGEKRLMLRQIRVLSNSDLRLMEASLTTKNDIKFPDEKDLNLSIKAASPTFKRHGFDKTTNGDLDSYVAGVIGEKSSFVEFQLKKTKDISIEDGKGKVNYTISDDGTILKTDRPMVPGYYGILVRLPADHGYHSLELMDSPQRDFFIPSQNKMQSYFPLSEKLTLHVPRIIDFHLPLAKKDLVEKTVLMLCHDQSIDRRIISQATSLINLGIKVILVALSFSAEESDEITPEGIDIRRISLNDIIPENSVYKSYMKRCHQINDLMTKAEGKLNFMFPKLAKINWHSYLVHLLLTYRNKRLHDPLPFLSAFYNKCASIPCDLIQVHDLPALEAAVKLAKKKKVPIVYDAHELYPEQSAFSKVQTRICHENEKKWIKEVDHVFTVNESIAEEMAKRYQIPKPTSLFNALNLQNNFHDSLTPNILHKRLNLPEERRILLFQGGLSPHRNLENLIKAFQYVKTENVDLVILGSGDLLQKLVTMAKRYRLLDKRIYFLPAVPQNELLSYTAEATMGIIPYPHVDLNSYYCTPNKLFEFIQAELPIIANDSPELNRFVKDQGFGITKLMKSDKNIAQAIDAAFSSADYPTWKANLSKDNHLFSWLAEEKKYTDVMLGFLRKKSIVNKVDKWKKQ